MFRFNLKGAIIQFLRDNTFSIDIECKICLNINNLWIRKQNHILLDNLKYKIYLFLIRFWYNEKTQVELHLTKFIKSSFFTIFSYKN